VAFADEAYGRLRGASTSETDERHLFGVGGGLRIQVYKNIYARVEWGYTVGNRPLTDSRRSQFHFRLQAEV
jgi:hemolysin activation/secretion protein